MPYKTKEIRNSCQRKAYASDPSRREKARLASQKYRKAHPEKMAERRNRFVQNLKSKGIYSEWRRSRRLKTKYGLTVEEWDDLFEKQGMKCACCGGTEHQGKYGWVVDHDHQTDAVRGIVCNPCNVMIGMSKESIERLQFGINYLKRFMNA